MRRDFSERRRSRAPLQSRLKGLGVPIGEAETNATSTAANEETVVEFKEQKLAKRRMKKMY